MKKKISIKELDVILKNVKISIIDYTNIMEETKKFLSDDASKKEVEANNLEECPLMVKDLVDPVFNEPIIEKIEEPKIIDVTIPGNTQDNFWD